MPTPEERLLALSRDVYADHKQRHGRAQQVALGMLAFNGVFLAALGGGVWEASSNPVSVPGLCLWLLTVGALLSLAAAGIHVFVAARATMTWPDPGLLCERYEETPGVGDAMFIARLYAGAVADNQPVVNSQFRCIAVANVLTVVAFVTAYAALLQLML